MLVGTILFCGCVKTRHAETNLRTALHTRPSGHTSFDSNQITNALLAFGGNHYAAFAILKEGSNETNTFIDAGRIIDTNRFVRAGAIFGIGQLGKSVPEATSFLWEIIYSRSAADRFQAFRSLQHIGFDASDIPMLAKLLADPASNQNILTKLVPETISFLIETNPSAARPYLPSVENLLDNSNPDIQFRAALALVKSEGKDNPKVISALHALYRRPNARLDNYYKFISAQVLAEAGSPAKALVPDLLEFAKLPDKDYTYQLIARILPDLGSQIPEVAQALKEQQNAQLWTKKWKSGSYTLDDLRVALKEPYQAQIASKHLAELGVAAKIALPDMIQALWGKDEDTRNEILADIHKIDANEAIAKIDVENQPYNIALGSAHSVLEKMPPSPQNKALTDSCFQMMFTAGWILPEELTTFTNTLAAQSPEAYAAFVEGLKPPSCAMPATKPILPKVWDTH